MIGIYAEPTQPKVASKPRVVFSLPGRPGGASLGEIVRATRWQGHSARAALTGLKKKGHAINRARVDGVSRYTIEADILR
jgi:hypothetical protein